LDWRTQDRREQAPDHLERDGRHAVDVSARTTALLGTGIRVRVYSPGSEGPVPAIIRFSQGHRDLASTDWRTPNQWCSEIRDAVRATVIAVDYGPSANSPREQVRDDCYRAIVWAAEQSEQLHLNPERIVLSGAGAAADLAVAVALLARARRGPNVASLVLENPTLLGTHASGDAHLEDLPPTYVVAADLDSSDPRDQSAWRLREAGAAITLSRPRGHDGRPGRDNGNTTDWRDAVVAGIRSGLAETTVLDLRTEHRDDALGIALAAPRLSWRVASSRPGWRQTAYELEARGQLVHVESDESVLVPWPFTALRSRERVDVRVRVRGADGVWSPWTERCAIEAALLDPNDWSASFIAVPWAEDSHSEQPAHYYRREIVIDRPVACARLYASALGVYEAYVNGQPVGRDVLTPGWTSYHHRLEYQTYDVTALLREGPNVLGAITADGWYRGRLGFREQRNLYGQERALLSQLEINYEDGTVSLIASDGDWHVRTGPILASSLYDGERYDARLELNGWCTPGYDDSDWAGARTLDHDMGVLAAPVGPPVHRMQLLEPREIWTSPSGQTMVDFGQNLVGRLRIRVSGEAGDTVTMRHAEILERGELCVWPLRAAAATDSYTLAGTGTETWEPHFTFHGFRYAEISGWPGELTADDIRAVVIHSDLERTGWFHCSDPLLERLHDNVLWSMRGNFLYVPTDCPQRDERLAWTGDIQLFAPTACFLYDCSGFLTSWLADLAAEQAELRGRVPNVIPDALPVVSPDERHDWDAPAAGWGDAAAIVPWVLYQRTGNVEILARQLPSMTAWVDYVEALAGPTRLWDDQGFQFGDWLDPSAPPDEPDRAMTDPSLVATAYFARSAEIVADVAAVLGDVDKEARYRRLAAEVRDAFVRRYREPGGRLVSDSQTAYAMALEFCLLRECSEREAAGRRLVALVRANGYRIATGFLGTPLICDALSSVGEHPTAYQLLLERDCPSWLYPVTMGATTIWERWDSLRPDGSVQPSDMTSFNHYAFGAIADWLHRTVAGLAPAAPGYRRIAIRPVPGGGLTFARARHRTPYGLAEVEWRLIDDQLHLAATVPPNTEAEVTLPSGATAPFTVGSGRHKWVVPAPEDQPREMRR
jgi:alpha-L-rhamnosidase